MLIQIKFIHTEIWRCLRLRISYADFWLSVGKVVSHNVDRSTFCFYKIYKEKCYFTQMGRPVIQ